MNDELLSVVDENDQVIGGREGRAIYALGLRQRAVHILIFNHAQQVFL